MGKGGSKTVVSPGDIHFVDGGNAEARVDTDALELDQDVQRIPKVTRHLPHIRQPERRDKNKAGPFTAYVNRQYLPQFFRFI